MEPNVDVRLVVDNHSAAIVKVRGLMDSFLGITKRVTLLEVMAGGRLSMPLIIRPKMIVVR